MIVLDPYPRTLDQIFTPEDRAPARAARRRSAGTTARRSPTTPSSRCSRTWSPSSGRRRSPPSASHGHRTCRRCSTSRGTSSPTSTTRSASAAAIQVLCIAPVYAQPVAEMALGLALAAAREIPAGDAAIRAGTAAAAGRRPRRGLPAQGQDARPDRVREPRSRAAAAPAAVRRAGSSSHDPWLQDATLRELGVEPVGLEELLASSRVVFVLSAVTTENAHAIGQEQLDLMQDGSVFVLASRAAVVDWDALMDTAASGRVQGRRRRLPGRADPGRRAGAHDAEHGSLGAPGGRRPGDLADRRHHGRGRPRMDPPRPAAAPAPARRPRDRRALPLEADRIRVRPAARPASSIRSWPASSSSASRGSRARRT